MGSDVYIFLDESGTFDFRSTSSKYFVLTAIVTQDPAQGALKLLKLKHEILARGRSTFGVRKTHVYEGFHCTEDPQNIRDQVFDIIADLRVSAYSVVVQKNKTNPAIQERRAFYKVVFGALLRGTIRRLKPAGTLHVFAASFNVKGKREDFVGGLKASLASERVEYFIHFHAACSHHMLQVADYVGWAIFRKYERADTRSYALVEKLLRSEFDLFRKGLATYY